MKRTLILSAVVFGLALVAASAMADNTFTVTTAAALDGTYGAECTHDGVSSNVAYVVSAHPASEEIIRIKFKISQQTLAYASNGDIEQVLLCRNDDEGPMLKLFIKRGSSFYKIVGFVRDDSLAWHKFGVFNMAGVTTNKSTVEVHYVAGAGTGYAKLFKNGIDSSLATGENLTNGNVDVDKVLLGMVFNIRSDATGTYYLDSYESYRTLS